jgi:hypothetical protein
MPSALREAWIGMKIEDEAAKTFQIYYLDIDGNPYEVEAEYDTVKEVLAHHYRLDSRYKIRVVDEYLTREEFERWARGQDRG